MRRLAWIAAAIVAGMLVIATAFDLAAPATSARLGAQLERRLSQLEARTLSIPGFEIAYLEGGRGEPLVLVHGFGADKDNFTRAARALTPHYRVVIPDLPGFGDSGRSVDARYRIEDQTARLDQIVAALGIDRAHFGGSSMGGWIVADYAARHPENVDSLWLLAPGGVTTARPSPMLEAYARTGKTGLVVERAQDFAQLLDLVMAQPPFLPPSMRKVLGERAARDHALHSAIFAQLHDQSQPLQDIAPQVRAPALIVWGERDQVLDVSGAQILKALLPRAQLIVMPGIGHLPMLEAPAQAVADYLTFRAAL